MNKIARFFLSSSRIHDDQITLDGEDAKHISRSLRMTIGERITVCDMQKMEYACEITAITAKEVTVTILSQKKNDTEPPYQAHLYQALPKGDKMEFIVQKAVEMGVSAITPFVCERCVIRLDAENAEKKRVRWQKIAEEAAKQCGRGSIPLVHAPISYEMVRKRAEPDAVNLFCYEGDDTTSIRVLLEQQKERKVQFVIGPEGGFSLQEVAAARENGFAIVGLGSRILRCETASGFVLTCLSYAWEL